MTTPKLLQRFVLVCFTLMAVIHGSDGDITNCGGLTPAHYWDFSGKCADGDPDPGTCSLGCNSDSIYANVGGITGTARLSQSMVTDAPTNSPHQCALNFQADNNVYFGDFGTDCISRVDLCSGGVTLTTWMKIDTAYNTGNRSHFTSGGQTKSGRGVWVYTVGPDGYLHFRVQSGTEAWLTSTQYPDNQWFHAVFTFKINDIIAIYIDGVLERSHQYAAVDYYESSDAETGVAVGATANWLESTDHFSYAAFSDVKVFHQLLTASEVEDLYSCESGITSQDCSDPGYPDNGQQVGSPSFTHGSTVGFECDLGYERIGNAELLCQDRKWDASLPECQGQQYEDIVAYASILDFVPDYYWDLSGKCSINDNDPMSCTTSCSDGSFYSVVGGRNGELFTPGATLTAAHDNAPHTCAYQSNGDSQINFGGFGDECLDDIVACPGGATQGITISVWLKINQASNTGERYYFSSGPTSKNGRGVALYSDFDSGIGLRFQANDNSNNFKFPWYVDIPTFPDNTWFHGVFVFKPEAPPEAKAYIDGVNAGNMFVVDINNALLSNWKYKYFGITSDIQDFSRHDSLGYAALSDMKIFYRALTATEVETLHNAEIGVYDCTDPGVPDNGAQVGNPSFRTGTSVMFVCDVGYTMDGGDVITCAEGTWSDTLPVCTGGQSFDECGAFTNPDGLRNIAVGKYAIQSSTKNGAVASRAVDGDKNSDLQAGKSCIKTKKEFQPWWKLDLGESKDIYQVIITNRQDCCSSRLKNAEVRVGNSPNFEDNPVCGMVLGKISRQETIIMNCGCGESMTGRYVSIQLVDKEQKLHVCEVEVMVL